jgi:hypothetical protein
MSLISSRILYSVNITLTLSGDIDLEGSGWGNETILFKNRSNETVFVSVEADSFLFSTLGVSNADYFCVPCGINESWWRQHSNRTMTICDSENGSKVKWKVKVQAKGGDVIVFQSKTNYATFHKQMSKAIRSIQTK